MQVACPDLRHSWPWRPVTWQGPAASPACSAQCSSARLPEALVWTLPCKYLPSFSFILSQLFSATFAKQRPSTIPSWAHRRTRNRTEQTDCPALKLHSSERVVSAAVRRTSCMEEASQVMQVSQTCLSGSPPGCYTGQSCRPLLFCQHFLFTLLFTFRH